MEVNPIINDLKDIGERAAALYSYLDYPGTKERLEEVERELEDPAVWNDPENAQKLGKERAALSTIVTTLDTLKSGATDARELLDMAVEEDDEETVGDVVSEVSSLMAKLLFGLDKKSGLR